MKHFDLRIAQWEDMIPAMLAKDSDLARRLIRDGKGVSEQSMRPVREADDDALIGREVAGRKAIAVHAVPLAEMLTEAWHPGVGHDRGHDFLNA